MNYKSFCGGIFETNCYLFEAPEGWILFDAPEGASEWARSLKVEPKLLLLTHGHIDHVQDVARIKRQFGCPIGCHPLTAPMISDREFFRNFGFALEIEPSEPDFLIEETPSRNFLGADFQILEVPGHCPGSLCFYSRKHKLLIGGDVLFAGSIGRGDLPGGENRNRAQNQSVCRHKIELFSDRKSQPVVCGSEFREKRCKRLKPVDLRNSVSQRTDSSWNVLEEILVSLDQAEEPISTQRLHQALHRA